MSWDANTAATTRPFDIELAVWSQCNRFIAITWEGADTVDVLDSITLQRLQNFEFPQDIPTRHRVLVFSPDSRILTCSSCDDGDSLGRGFFVVSWILQTGSLASVIRWKGPKRHLEGNPSITYSANGKMVGVFYRHYGNADIATIFICDVFSGTHMHSHSLNGHAPLSNDIWTHGEFLRFATAEATTITIWEVRFTSGAAPTEFETISVTNNVSPTVIFYMDTNKHGEEVRLPPAPCRLARVFMGEVRVWDARNSKYLLRCEDTEFCPMMSFSFDGRFFACSTRGSDVYLWKESPAGYILHEILASSTPYSKPLLSRNGESILTSGGRMIQLWRTKVSTTPPPSLLTQAPRCTDNFVVEFSPDGTLAVAAMRKGYTVTVLNLESGAPQLTIDAGMEVYGLGVTGNAVAVIGGGKVVTWNLPVGDCVPGARVDLGDSTRTIKFGYGWEGPVTGASISPDFCHIALTTLSPMGDTPLLRIYSVPTRKYSIYVRARGNTPWFSPDGRDIWCAGDSGADVWRVGGGNELERPQLREVYPEHLPEGYPWDSSLGYRVTDDWWILGSDDWWILGPDGKRLLMLPPPWQSYAVPRVRQGRVYMAPRIWKGRFLGLLHCGLSEPVILELNP